MEIRQLKSDVGMMLSMHMWRVSVFVYSTSISAAVLSRYLHSPTSKCAGPTGPCVPDRRPRTAASRRLRLNLVTGLGPCCVSFERMTPRWSHVRVICRATNISTMWLCQHLVNGRNIHIKSRFTSDLSAVNDSRKDYIALRSMRYSYTVTTLCHKISDTPCFKHA